MKRSIERFWTRHRGATAVAYVLMVALIAGVIVRTVSIFGMQVHALFTSVEQAMTPDAG